MTMKGSKAKSSSGKEQQITPKKRGKVKIVTPKTIKR